MKLIVLGNRAYNLDLMVDATYSKNQKDANETNLLLTFAVTTGDADSTEPHPRRLHGAEADMMWDYLQRFANAEQIPAWD